MVTADAAALCLAAIVQSSDDAIISEDLAGNIQTWNPAAERIFGYSAADALGKPIRLLVPGDGDEEERAIRARVHAGRAVDHFETVRLGSGGQRILVSLAISPIRNAAGAIVGFSTIAREITLQKRMEHETYRLAALVNSSDDAIVSKKLDGTILTWNPAAERMFGYTAAEVIGKSIRIIIPPDRMSEKMTCWRAWLRESASTITRQSASGRTAR